MSVHIYDPAEVLVLVSGVPLSGFSRDQFISVEFDEDTYFKEVGIYGEVSRYRNVNNSGSMSVTLSQTSNSHTVLSALSSLDRQWGVGIVPFAMVDLRGGFAGDGAGVGSAIAGAAFGSKILSAFGWVRKPPPLVMGSSLMDRTWTFDLARLDIFQVSGNQTQSI